MFKRVFYTLLLLIIVLSQHVLGVQGSPFAKNGVLDLRKEQFADNVPIDGEWLFYWNKLLLPSEIAGKRSHLTFFPELWNNMGLPAFGYATYQITILLPKNPAPLRISMPDLYSAYRLFANGVEVADNGKVSTSAKGFVPHWQYRAFNVPAGTDTLKLVLQVANFVHSKGGIKKSLMIGHKDAMELYREQVTAVDLLLTGCLLMGGLFFLGLYLLGSRDKAILMFSVYALVFGYRMIGSDNYILHTIFPNLDWYLTVRLEYMTLFAGIGLFGLYTKRLYPEEGEDLILYTISGACFLFTGAALFTPPIFFTSLINPFLLVMAFCLAYVPFIYLKAYRKKRPGSIYALWSILALTTVFGISLFHYWGLIPQMQLLSFIGYIGFFFLQSLVLSHRVAFVLKKAGEQAQQGLVAKTEFLSTMSHEIRTPLNSVIGMSYLLQKNDPREDQKEQLDVMVFSANNLLNIVNDILDYSKIEAGKVTFEYIDMDIIALAGNVVNGMKSIAQDKGIGLRLKIDENFKNKVLGDPTRLTQVITNLVHNAIKFTFTGEVMLDIQVTDDSPKRITLHIAVKDTGIGISKEKQAIIFERFTQADSSTSRGFGGTGLGLSISQRILELQGSRLQLNSEVNKGSTFYFVQTFDKSELITAAEKPGSNKDKDNKAFSGMYILLVDDNPLNVMVAQSFLKRWGAMVDVAVNGEDALAKLDPERHSLILMDLQMPVMDGYQASSRIREKGIKTPIIALTATLPSEITSRLAETGMNDIVVKPFMPDELYTKVYQQLFVK